MLLLLLLFASKAIPSDKVCGSGMFLNENGLSLPRSCFFLLSLSLSLSLSLWLSSALLPDLTQVLCLYLVAVLLSLVRFRPFCQFCQYFVPSWFQFSIFKFRLWAMRQKFKIDDPQILGCCASNMQCSETSTTASGGFQLKFPNNCLAGPPSSTF